MKTHLLSTSAILALSAILLPQAHADVNVYLPTDDLVTFPEGKEPSVVLPDAARAFDATSTANVITMVKNVHGYLAENVTIGEDGFCFYAADSDETEDPSEWTMTYYSLAPFGVNPPLDHYLNPLYKQHPDLENPAIKPQPGTYNIYYFDQLDNGQNYHMFALEPADGEGEVGFPPELYLLDFINDATALTEWPGLTGVYTATVVLPDYGFKISYQSQGYYIPGFLFGPVYTDDAEIVENKEIPIAFGTNTGSVFSYSGARVANKPGQERLVAAGSQVGVIVNLAGDTNFLQVVGTLPTSVEELIEIVSKPEPESYWSLEGTRLSDPEPGRITIARYADGHTAKIVVR